MAKKKPYPNFPSDKPDVKPAEPKKDFDKWFMTGVQLTSKRGNEMDLVVNWSLGRTYKEAGEDMVELSAKNRVNVFQNVLSDEFAVQYPEITGLLNDMLVNLEAMCKKQGGPDAQRI